ncbi:hypothetical protein BDZ97DRAFT_1795332 [Flammula alnicola]|nr:hypothetical protein BDZ97DRAFT_1795332 [Flammula alnicola]
MEEFAAEEKTKLGLNSPLNLVETRPPQPTGPDADLNAVPSSSNLVAVQPDTAGTQAEGAQQPSQLADEAPSDQASQRPLRHRKLSQSNAHPRIHRKGIGGKMALFEATANDTPPPSPPASATSSAATPACLPAFVRPHRGIPSAPGLAGGILHTGHDRPYRFSFYSNALSATIHARSLSELPAEGQTFEQLFTGAQAPAPPPPDDSTEAPSKPGNNISEARRFNNGRAFGSGGNGQDKNGMNSLGGGGMGAVGDDQDGNTWWLDVQSPTDEEMKMLSKVFSIHPLTTEDILMEETREKIELFRNYYLVCFRSFDQDPYSPTHLEPLNMYIIVFRQGILSFHFRPTPHPQNVRRRIKQLKDYISVTSDWISYALIDDITDAFGPLIQGIEYEVDSIDELVLILKEAEQSDMLRRIGTCRKKVMGLLRLMGNKADVVKGLAKRCNENWRVAPTSDIGLYLSDIQDHLITMTQNLNHYEKILSRSHSNYLAQISIEMTDANNQINDVLSKLTALGTVLIPMNLVTGLWGMNVHVPGQNVDVSPLLTCWLSYNIL